MPLRIWSAVLAVVIVVCACGEAARDSAENLDTTTAQVADTSAGAAECMLVEEGFGPPGEASVSAEEVVAGLDTPWGIAFLPGGDMLVTERAGDIRLVRAGRLVDAPVATVETQATGEGGLLGIAAHPDFASNRYFYVYFTASSGNRVERWRLSDDGSSAQVDRTILEGIPSARYHNGGRLRFGPDGNLFVGTGDARDPESAQNRGSLAGKLLRITPDGDVPPDNPFAGSPVYLLGIRNTQGFDWPDSGTVWLTDHGPTGEFGRQGHDEINVAQPGANLGWPPIYGCETAEGMVAPALTWQTAVPPGGAAIYRGSSMPEWHGDLMVGTLGSRHLHRVSLEGGRVAAHAVYLRGDQPDGYGRLREVITGPDDALYITTSNCDGRGTCPPDGDKILRVD